MEGKVLKVTLFGIGRASYYNHDLPGFPGQQACLLFCYLLLHKQQPHHREQLATLFWGEHSSEVARKYLRNALWRLRQVLQSTGAPPDDFLFLSEESITFLNTGQCWLDIEAFESTINRCQHLTASQLEPDRAVQLESAVDLYNGDLLENVYDDWCLYERERLRLLYLNTLQKLMTYYGLKGRYAEGIRCGERILARDNTREKVHRQLMWLHYLSGDREAALLQYRRCARILRDELNAQPMDETRLLHEQMRIGHVSGAGSAWSESAVHPTQMPPASAQLQPLVEQTMHRLFQLQQMIDETRAELRQIERTLNEASLRP
jgi:DNA-binding SARP family transcriptional activator